MYPPDHPKAPPQSTPKQQPQAKHLVVQPSPLDPTTMSIHGDLLEAYQEQYLI